MSASGTVLSVGMGTEVVPWWRAAMRPAAWPAGSSQLGFVQLFAAAGKYRDLSRISLISAIADEDRTVLLMTIPLATTGEPIYITEHGQVCDGQLVDVRVFWYSLPAFD